MEDYYLPGGPMGHAPLFRLPPLLSLPLALTGARRHTTHDQRHAYRGEPAPGAGRTSSVPSHVWLTLSILVSIYYVFCL